MKQTLKLIVGLLASAILIQGCSKHRHSSPETNQAPARHESKPIALPAPLPPASSSLNASLAAAPGARHFRRSELNRVIEKGPGHILQFVRVAPSYKSRRFLGFKLNQVLSKDARFQAPNVSMGDIILRINKVRIQTPGDFHKAFLTLKDAKEIEFDILRDTNRFLVVYPVLNDVTIRPDSAPQ